MPAPTDNFVSIGGAKFGVKPPDQSRGEKTFVELHRDRHIPRQDVDGRIGEQNLDRSQWAWTLTDWAGGEGRRVYDSRTQGESPHFWKTEGGIDTRVSGQLKMSPIAQVVLDNDGGSVTTRINAADQTVVSGTWAIAGTGRTSSSSSGELKTANRTPAAGAVQVVYHFASTDDADPTVSYTWTTEVRRVSDNNLMASNTGTMQPVSIKTIALNFTSAGSTNYTYNTKFSGNTGVATFSAIYTEEVAGGTPPTDVRALVLGFNEKPFAYHWDGTNTDIWAWDQANSQWDAVAGNVNASLPVAATNSDKFQYLLVANRIIFRGTDAAAAQTTYTSAPASTTQAGGIAVAGNRLYGLYFGGTGRGLYEYDLDGTAVPYAGTVKMAQTDLPDEEAADTTIRQRMTSIGNGVRFFINSRGGISQVYEYSGGAGRPLRHATLGGGYTMTCIHHFGGITWVGALYSGSGDSPSTDRASLWYIGADEVMRLAVEFRPDDPDPMPPTFIATDQHYVYVQQGNNLWQYDPTRGAHVMDTYFSSTSELGRGIAVLDTKKWAAYSGEGPQVTQDSYPIDQMVYQYSPLWDFDTQSQKVLLSFVVGVQHGAVTNTVSLDYELNESGTWVNAGTSQSSDLGVAYLPFTVSTPADTKVFTRLRWRVGLKSANGQTSPVVRVVTTWARISPDDHDHRFEMTLLLDDDVSGSHLPRQQMTGHQKANLLRTAHATGDLLTFVDHYSSSRPGDTNSYTAVVAGLEIAAYPKGNTNQHRYGEAVVELEVID